MPCHPARAGRAFETHQQPSRFVVPDLHGVATGDGNLRMVRTEGDVPRCRVVFPLLQECSRRDGTDGYRAIRTTDGNQPAVSGKIEGPEGPRRVAMFLIDQSRLTVAHGPEIQHVGLVRVDGEVLPVRRKQEAGVWDRVREATDFDAVAHTPDGDATVPIASGIAR